MRAWLKRIFGGAFHALSARQAHDDKRRAAESARALEDVLLAEHQALFDTPRVQSTSPLIQTDEITDLPRIAEYLYEASIKHQFSRYDLSLGADGPRAMLRARIWDALDADLRRRLEVIATGFGDRPLSQRHATEAAHLLEDPATAANLATALNRIISGEQLTGRAAERVHS